MFRGPCRGGTCELDSLSRSTDVLVISLPSISSQVPVRRGQSEGCQNHVHIVAQRHKTETGCFQFTPRDHRIGTFQLDNVEQGLTDLVLQIPHQLTHALQFPS